MIRYGFACKTIGVPGASQTSLTLARAGRENLLRVSRHNLRALGVMLAYCTKQRIPLLRISSDVIPLAGHPQVSFDWQNLLREELAEVAGRIRDSGIRVSMHPGQYTILNSPRDEVVARAVDDLRFHADFLDAVGADGAARIVLHLGGAYGDKRIALERLRNNLEQLPKVIVDRLALENDERIFTIEEVLDVCGEFGLPAIFDVFHHALHPPPYGSPEYWLDKAGATWNTSSGRQKIHYSQQLPGGKPGTHSQTIGMRDFLVFHAGLGDRELDVMLEVKDKNLSAVKCANLTMPNRIRGRMTDEWARYKYLVLEHEPAAYLDIRTLLNTNLPDPEAFYARLEQALTNQVTPGHARNAAQHVWGYLDKLATPAETRRIMANMGALENDPAALPRLKRNLLALAGRLGNGYLLYSLYFYLPLSGS